MSDSRTFMCLLQGDSAERAFPVDITTSKLVGHLKDKVKEKKAPYFNHISADELTLYRVTVSVDDSDWIKDLDLKRYDYNSHDSDIRKLFPTDSILEAFQYTPPKRCIHLIVVPPAVVSNVVAPIIASTMMSRISVIEKELEEVKDHLAALKYPTQDTPQNQSTTSDVKSDIVESPVYHGGSFDIAENEVITPGSMLKKPDTDVPPDVVNSSLKCAVCERSSPEDGGNLKACAACLLVHYCSKKCQTADWKKHKSDCRPIVTTRRDVVTTRRADPTNEIDLQTGFFKNAFPDNICIFCGIRPTTFPTEASRREYSEISRICPSCWHVDVFDPDSTFEEFERSRRELHACGRILIIQKNPPHAWQCLCCREVIWNKQQCRIHAAKKCTTDLNILRQRNEVGVNYEMRTLKQNMAKTELFTQWSNLSDEGVRALVESLKQNTSLIKLIIEFTNNGDMGARAMMESLKHNTTLIELACHWSSITGEGARGLAESLKRNTTLTKLDLAFNKIGDQGARSLAECLKQNTTLIELVLWKNDIGDEGAHALAELLLQNKTLTELELWKNEIGDQGACALAESLKKNKTLISLSLRQNGIGDRGARALADSLKPNTTLIELCLQVNGIGEQGARALAKALKQNKTLKTSGWEWLEWCLKA